MVLDLKGTCPICLFELTEEDINNNELTTITCGHSYHTDCLRAFCRSEVQNGKHKITCCVLDDHTNLRCNRLLSDPTVKNLVTERDYDKYCKWKLRKEFAQNFAECPYCETQDIFPDHEKNPIVKCSSCLKKFCFTHGNAHPISMTCEQFELQHYHKNVRTINTIAQTCPGCFQRVERIDGCSKMTCSCGTRFCFLCGENLNSLGYQHFNDTSTLNKVFGCSGLMYHNALPKWIYWTRFTYHPFAFITVFGSFINVMCMMVGIVRPQDILAVSIGLHFWFFFWALGSPAEYRFEHTLKIFVRLMTRKLGLTKVKYFNNQKYFPRPIDWYLDGIIWFILFFESLFLIVLYSIGYASGDALYGISFVLIIPYWYKDTFGVFAWRSARNRRYGRNKLGWIYPKLANILYLLIIVGAPFAMTFVVNDLYFQDRIPSLMYCCFYTLWHPYLAASAFFSYLRINIWHKIYFFIFNPWTSMKMIPETRLVAPIIKLLQSIYTGTILTFVYDWIVYALYPVTYVCGLIYSLLSGPVYFILSPIVFVSNMIGLTYCLVWIWGCIQAIINIFCAWTVIMKLSCSTLLFLLKVTWRIYIGVLSYIFNVCYDACTLSFEIGYTFVSNTITEFIDIIKFMFSYEGLNCLVGMMKATYEYTELVVIFCWNNIVCSGLNYLRKNQMNIIWMILISAVLYSKWATNPKRYQFSCCKRSTKRRRERRRRKYRF